jgi:predicted NBD/HSP70 family sugar kinase
MYLGVDVGGTKTLVAALTDDGVIKEQKRFLTSKDYKQFVADLKGALDGLETKDFKAAGVGIPGLVNRSRGMGIKFGNLPWTNAPVQADVEKLAGCPAVIENDAKMAGLSESMLLHGKFHKVIYVTISTGIGFALVTDRVIDVDFGDAGGRTILLEHKGKMTSWEDFAGGRAIVERFGKKAADITDAATWKTISHDLAKGFIQLIAMFQPEIIVIGGSVGVYFDRFGALLDEEIKKYQLPLVSLPKIQAAKRPDEAVIFGCYDLAKQVYGNAKVT